LIEKIWIASHRRSGTHLCMEMLNANFNIELSEQKGNKTHRTFDRLKKHLGPNDKVIYVVRHAGDVMLSCFKWWQTTNESFQSHIIPHLQNKTLSDFLKGVEIPDFREFMIKQWEYDLGMINNPLIYWKVHAESYLHNKDKRICIVRYEDLKKKEILSEVAQFLGLTKNKRKFASLNKPVGYYMGEQQEIKNNSNKWVTEFSESDKKIMIEKAGSLLKQLTYLM